MIVFNVNTTDHYTYLMIGTLLCMNRRATKTRCCCVCLHTYRNLFCLPTEANFNFELFGSDNNISGISSNREVKEETKSKIIPKPFWNCSKRVFDFVRSLRFVSLLKKKKSVRSQLWICWRATSTINLLERKKRKMQSKKEEKNKSRHICEECTHWCIMKRIWLTRQPEQSASANVNESKV